MSLKESVIMAKACVSVVAIVALAFLESLAIYRQMDGAMFFPVVVAIAGIAGYNLKEVVTSIKGVLSNGKSGN